ncbi:MAG: gamma-glutamyl-gamma-aminobutyrate hydrolase family protein [Clostridia bacterium]|nr:gamma-glutamyl-gamma-aminobutyrate hydrolase family protein [Clostridia bacterium]
MIPIIAMVCPSREEKNYKISRDYVNAVLSAGAVPLMIPPQADGEKLDRLLDLSCGLILTGGGDLAPERYGESTEPFCGEIDRERDEEEYILLEKALRRGMPILGICRGFQTLNCFMGGTLYQDITAQTGSPIKHAQGDRRYEKMHEVDIREGTLLSRFMGCGTAGVNTCHHQGIKALGSGLISSAAAPDGLIEGIEIPGQDVLAVQWHPEALSAADDPQAKAIFSGWVRLAAAKGEKA